MAGTFGAEGSACVVTSWVVAVPEAHFCPSSNFRRGHRPPDTYLPDTTVLVCSLVLVVVVPVDTVRWRHTRRC
jgi:hypothetical protein